MKLAIATCWMLTLLVGPASAYQILLDLDTDNDPYTINQFTEESSALVRMILVPDGGSEWITHLEFGLGGTCWVCPEWDVHIYGTSTDLFAIYPGDPWLTHPNFESSWIDFATCAYCCGNPGFHALLFADAAGEGFQLDENIFIRDFMAWEIEHPVCEVPPPDLMAFACDYQPCNTIMLSGYVATERATWDAIKSLY